MAVREETGDRSASADLRRGREEARQIGGDIGDIAADLQQLANAELRLAQAEARENVGRLVSGLVWGVIAAVHALLAVAFVFVTIMLVLGIWLAPWAAALITTGIIAVFTAVVAGLAYQAFKRFSVTPRRTMDSLKEDLRWLKSQATSNGK